jgi:hypothetical protein
MYNGLKIEIQLRSRQQHAWATAVETVDAFTSQGLKNGNGQPGWQRFFALMGTYIAEKEQCRSVPNTPTDSSILKDEITYLAKELEVIEHLESYRGTLHTEALPGAQYYVVELDVPSNETRIIGFKKDQFEMAQQVYLAMERQIEGQQGRDVVLVSVGSLDSLKRAYPNYFADTDVFLRILAEAIANDPAFDS